MRKLILQEFMSIDGFVADREKKTSFFDGTEYGLGKDVEVHQKKFIETLDLIVLGANTYQFFAAHWPDTTAEQSLIAEVINTTPKVVLSRSLKEVQWGKWGSISLVSEDAVPYIKSLKEAGRKNMVVWGSLSLAKSLLKAHLFDEIQLFSVPVAIGKGDSLFPEEYKLLPLKLTDTKFFSEGALLHTYKPQYPSE